MTASLLPSTSGPSAGPIHWPQNKSRIYPLFSTASPWSRPQCPPSQTLSQRLTSLLPSVFLPDSSCSPWQSPGEGGCVTIQITLLPCSHILHGSPLLPLYNCTSLAMHKAYMVSPAGIFPSVLSQGLCRSCALCLEHCFPWLAPLPSQCLGWP